MKKEVKQTQSKPASRSEKTENKTLVVYASKCGATEEAANIIAKTLSDKNGLDVEMVNIRKEPNPEITQYCNLVIGGGVRAGKVYKETSEFMKQDLSDKRVALFICSGAAGNKLHHDEIAEKYITKGLAKNLNGQLVAMNAFGGCIRIFGRAVVDRRDPAKIQVWAEELGMKLSDIQQNL